MDGSDIRFTVTAINATGYQWQQDTGSGWHDIPGAVNSTLEIQAATTSMSGRQYRVIVTGTSGTIASSAATLHVSPAAAAVAIVVQPTDKTIIEGQDVNFAVTATGTSVAYLWQYSADGTSWTNFDAPSQPVLHLPPQALQANGRRVKVIVSNSAGSVASNVVSLVVTPAPRAPVITSQPTASAVLASQTASFSVAAVGTPAPDVRWQRSTDGAAWLDIASAWATSLILPSVALTDSGSLYRVIVSNASGSVTSAVAQLTVNAATTPPAFATQPQDSIIPPGQDALFSAAATGTPTPSLQWQLNTSSSTWANINGATGTQYTLPAVTLLDSGKRFRVVATSDAGTRISAEALLTVSPLAPLFVSPPSSVTVVAPAPATFSAAATGLPAPAYQWQQSWDDGVSWTWIPGATASSYTTDATDVIRDKGLKVRVVASNAAGTVTSPTAQLTVKAERICSGPRQSGWCWANPHPQGKTLFGIAHTNGGLQVTVGLEGTILRSADLGANWSLSASGTTQKLKGVAFSGAGVGVVVGETGTLLRSTDEGATWTSVASGTNAHLNSVAFSGSAGVVAGDGGVLLRSADGGSTWSPVTSGFAGDLAGVAFVTETEVVAVGSGGAVLRSADSGLHWAFASVPTGSIDNLNAVAFSSTGVGIAVGGHSILRSVDGGRSWNFSPSSVPESFLQGVAFQTSNVVYAVGGAQILISGDGGQNWGQVLSYPPASLNVYAISIMNGRTGAMVGGHGLVIEFNNGTLATDRETVDYEGLSRAAKADALTAVAVGPVSHLLRSADGGKTWEAKPNPSGRPLRSVAFANSNVGVAVGDGAVVRTTDGGNGWNVVNGYGSGWMDIAFGDAGIGLAVGGDQAIWRTSNGGVAWTLVNGSPWSSWLRGVAFGSATLAVAVGDVYAGKAWMLRSTDAGLTWASIDSGSTQHLTAVAFASPSVGVAVGHAGTILRTTDGGAHWSPVASGTAQDLKAVSFASSAVGYAAGVAGAILRTNDGGQNWTPLTAGTALDFAGVTAVADDQAILLGDGGILFTVTGGR